MRSAGNTPVAYLRRQAAKPARDVFHGRAVTLLPWVQKSFRKAQGSQFPFPRRGKIKNR